MGICTRCKQDNPTEARFCLACGNPLAASCPICAGEVPPGARFCPSCGRPLADAETGAPEMIKLVTVLFADVVGSTEQAEHMLPEETRALMTDFFSAMSEEIRAEGGTIDRLIGDAVMADFGIPVAHEDDPVRAVRAAMRMLERLQKWNAEREPDSRIQIRIGINTGEVSAGGTLGEQLLVMGDAVNVASRLEQIAEPGTIVIGQRTARSVRDHFELRELDAVMVKGKSGPLTAFVLVGPRDAAAPQLRAPLVGREAELNKLRATLQQVTHDGEPQIVAVVAEPGAGKSRLLEEFVTASASHTKVSGGRCLPYDHRVTLWPFREILRTEAGLLSSDDVDAARHKIRDLVARSLPSGDPALERTTSALAATIGLGDSDADPREVYREILRGWRHLLAALADGRPLVITFEDMHWADETTLEMVAELVERVTAPVLFICSMRPDLLTAHAEWVSRLRNYSAIHIESLPEEASARLVAELLRADRVPAVLTRQILATAEGNPFFIEEILRRLIDEGSLRPRGDSWELDSNVARVEIPDNVQAVILARLDLLAPEERTATQLAAVVGRTFWAGALRRLVGAEDVDSILRTLRRREFVEEKLTSSIAGDSEYRFKHLLTRDVAYESLPRKARGKAHAAVADWIESTIERPSELAEVLAHHYENAFRLLADEDARMRARSFCLEAAGQAMRRFAVAQADSLARRAVALSTSGAERVEALEKLGDLHVLSFRSDSAWSAYTDAMSELEKGAPGNQSVFARLAAKASIVPTRWRGTMDDLPEQHTIEALIEQGLAAVEHSDSRERALLLASKAFLFGVWLERPGESYAHEALAIAERIGDADLASVAIDAAVSSLMAEGRWGEMCRLDSRRVDFVSDLRDVREVADAFATTAESCRTVGDYRRAVELASQGIERSRGVDAGSYLHNLVERAYAHFFSGNWDDALADHAEVERLQEEDEGFPGTLVMWSYGMAVLCHELRGDEEKVVRYLEVVEEFNDRNQRAGRRFNSYLALTARAVARRGEFERARAWLETERSYFVSSHLEALTEIALLEGPRDDWRTLIERAREEADHAELRALPLFADRLEGVALLRVGDAAGGELLRRSAAGFGELGGLWEAAYSELWLAHELVRMGQGRSAEGLLSSCAPVFDKLGSRREQQLVETLLGEL
ncbi:MAG TPA: adenylate/guanylate cyclase domain-containing protein [Actinomycetota bacterium]|nr:adenylate/guanylate cyclase domain-containing protein [Actinomycetota bacterium]